MAQSATRQAKSTANARPSKGTHLQLPAISRSGHSHAPHRRAAARRAPLLLLVMVLINGFKGGMASPELVMASGLTPVAHVGAVTPDGAFALQLGLSQTDPSRRSLVDVYAAMTSTSTRCGNRQRFTSMLCAACTKMTWCTNALVLLMPMPHNPW